MNLIETAVNFRKIETQRVAIFRGETVHARYTFTNGEAPMRDKDQFLIEMATLDSIDIPVCDNVLAGTLFPKTL